jgi:hypothetical protein
VSDRPAGQVRQPGLWAVGLAVAVAVVVAGCTGGGGAAAGGPGSSGPDAAKVVFVATGGNSYTLRVAGPDGRSPTDLLPVGYSPLATLVGVSDDGSVLAVVARHQSAAPLLVVQHGRTRVVPVPADGVVLGLAVAPDGHAVYFGADNGAVMRWDVTSGTESTLCARCALYAVAGWLAVSPDARTIAISTLSGQYAGPTWLYVVDAPSGRVLWQQSGTGADLPEGSGMVFADDDTLVLPIGNPAPGHNPVIHQISGLRSGHPVDVSTGVSGYGPIRRLHGLWWYYRDNLDGTTTAYVNPDLTPAGERKLADRVDGPTSFDYLPVTTAPLPAVPPATTSPTPSR